VAALFAVNQKPDGNKKAAEQKGKSGVVEIVVGTCCHGTSRTVQQRKETPVLFTVTLGDTR
jgi:hypothetical protein